MRRDDGGIARLTAAAGVLSLCGWMVWFALASVDLFEPSASARIEAQRTPHDVDAPVGGAVVSASLAVGRRVAAGEVLITLDAEDARTRLAREQARRASLVEEIDALKRESEQRRSSAEAAERAAEAEAAVAEAHGAEATATRLEADGALARARTLSAKGGLAKAETDRRVADAAKAAAVERGWASEALRIRLAASAAARAATADVERLAAEIGDRRRLLGEAEGEAKRIAGEIERHTIRAPVAGILGDAPSLAPGAVIATGQRLATIVPSGGLVVVAEFPAARALGRVKVGQPADLRLDGYPWIRFGALPLRVAAVDGEVRDSRVKVVLALDGPTPPGVHLEHGLSGAVEVTVDHASPAMLVLREVGLLLGAPAQAAEGGS